MVQIMELIEVMVSSIVDETEHIQIEEETSEQGILYEITVSKDDIGKLIGKGGRIASALRTIAKASGAKNGVRVLVNVKNKPKEK